MERFDKRRKFAKFLSLSVQERQLFLEALVLQVWIGLMLKIIPFRWIPRLFSSPQSTILIPQSAVSPDTLNRKSQIANRKSQPSALTPNPSPLKSHASRLYQIKATIQRASLISPWTNKCLIQSLAARRMLNRRKIQSQLSLGVAKNENGKLIAHAWLKVGDFEIVEKGLDFSELYLF